MANISTLTVSLVAETAKFRNDLKRARSSSAKWGRAIKTASRVAVAGLTAVTVAGAALVKQSLQVVDQQQKFADRLGISQRALAGLTLAGEQTGTTFRNLQLALQRSTRRIAEAAQGTGTAVKALDELGVSAQELNRLSTDEQFIRLAGAFEQVENQSDRVRLAFKLFDSEGVGLVNTLKLGEEGIRAYIQQVDDLGVSLNRNQTGAIEAANDSINLFKTSVRGLGNQLAAQFAPAIARAAEALTRFVSSITRNVERVAINVRNLFGLQSDLNSLSLAGLQQEYRLVQDEITALQFQIEDLTNGPRRGRRNIGDRIRRAQEQIEEYARYLDENIEKQKELIELQNTPLEPVGGDLGDAGAAADKLRAQYEAAIRAVGTASEKLQLELNRIREQSESNPLFANDPELVRAQTQAAVDAYIEEVTRARDEATAIQEQLQEQANQLARSVATPFEELQFRLAEIRQYAIDNPLIDPDVIRRLAEEAVAEYQEALKKMQEANDETANQMTEFQRQAFSNMQDILSEFLFDPFENGVKGMLKQFVDMLRKMIAQLVASKILEYFFGLFGAPTGAVSGVATGTTGPVSVPGRAIGGMVDRNRGYVVGERGPEYFSPGASGSVRPMGMLNFTSETNISGGEGLNVATLIPILEENNRKVKAELLDAFDRGAYA